jgi:hypothetical protein
LPNKKDFHKKLAHENPSKNSAQHKWGYASSIFAQEFPQAKVSSSKPRILACEKNL